MKLNITALEDMASELIKSGYYDKAIKCLELMLDVEECFPLPRKHKDATPENHPSVVNIALDNNATEIAQKVVESGRMFMKNYYK